ncbi:MAG: hypothetical protein V4594_25095 [Bacteroidota bacterium]
MGKQNLHKLFLFLLAAHCASCSVADKQPLSISFSSDSTAVVFKGIDPAGLNKLKNNQHPDSILHELISVLQTPSELSPDTKEMPLAGQFKLTDSTIVFHPDTLFVRGHDYLVITHLNTSFVDPKRILTNEVSLRMKPLQKLLSR